MLPVVDWLDFLNKNKDGLGVVGAVFLALVAAAWALYKHRADKGPPRSSRVLVSLSGQVQTDRGSVAVAGRDVHMHQATGEIVDNLLSRNERICRELGELAAERDGLFAAVATLQARQITVTSPSSIDAALEALARGNTSAAERLFQREAERGDENAAQAYRHLGAIAFLHDTHGALDAFSKATQRAPDDWESWNCLGQLLLRIGELGRATHAFEKLLSLSSTDPRKEAIALGNLGVVHYECGDFGDAFEFQEKSLAIATRLGFSEGIARAYGNLGTLCRSRGEPERALEFYEKALAVNMDLEHSSGIAHQCANIGTIYANRGDVARALEFHQRSLVIYTELGHKQRVAGQYGNLGNVYRLDGDLAQAIELLDKALTIFTELGCKTQVAISHGSLGAVSRERGDIDNAIAHYERSLLLNNEIGRKEGVARQCRNLGEAHKFRGDIEEARIWYTRAHELFQSMGALGPARDVEKRLQSLKGDIRPRPAHAG